MTKQTFNNYSMFFSPAKRLLAIIAFVLFVMLEACEKPLPKPAETMVALQNLQNLATVEYTISKVVKASDDLTWYKPGDRKILITCEAKMKAGIDLSVIKDEDIRISGKTISIRLPQPKILTVNMPPDKVKMAYSEIGFFRNEFTSEERNALVVQAEKQIWASGEALGILAQAKLNTQTFLNNYLVQLGFEKVNLTYDTERESK